MKLAAAWTEAAWLALVAVPPLIWGGESPVVVLACELVVLLAFAFSLATGAVPARAAPPALAAVWTAFLALALVATTQSVHPWTSCWELGWWLALVGLWRLVQAHLNRPEQRVRLLLAAVLAGALVSAVGLYSTYVAQDTLMGYQRVAYAGQVSGTFVNPSHMASFLIAGLPGAVALALAHPALDVRLFCGAAAVLELVAIVLSRSRGGWLGTLACMALLALAVPGARARRAVIGALGVLALLAALGLAAVPEAMPALRARFDTLVQASSQGGAAFGRWGPWGVALRLTRARPLAGWGPGTYPIAFLSERPPGYYYRPSHAHMDVLEFGVEIGAAGIALALLALALNAAAAKGEDGAQEHLRRLEGAALIAGLGGMLVTSLWDWPLRVPANALVFAALAGAVAARGGEALQRRGETAHGLACALIAVLVGGVVLCGRIGPELHAARGRQRGRDGDLAGAVVELAAAREAAPALWSVALDEVEARQQLAAVSAPRDGGLGTARAALSAVRAQPLLPDCWRALGGALVGMAMGSPAAARAGWFDLAQGAFGVAEALDPANHLPHLERGNTLWAAGRSDEAIAAYRAALDAYPVSGIGQFPEIVTQMTPVKVALDAPQPRTVSADLLAAALRLLELRKAHAPADFRTYRLLEGLYTRLGLASEAEREREDARKAGAP